MLVEWECDRNLRQKGVNWQFTTKDAPKLKSVKHIGNSIGFTLWCSGLLCYCWLKGYIFNIYS